jgi:hypothetical protein
VAARSGGLELVAVVDDSVLGALAGAMGEYFFAVEFGDVFFE